MKKIGDIFYENIYHIFLEYCSSNNLYYMSDLDGFDFDNLKNVKGIGVSKIEAIKKKYTLYANKDLDANVFSLIHSDNYNLSINSLSLFGISKNTINLLLESKVSTIKELALYGNSNLYKINSNIYSKIVKALSFYTVPLVKMAEEILGELKEEEHFKVVFQRAKGDTLNKIGSELNVTRERVRQIENAELKKIKSLLDIILNDIVLKYNYKSCINLNKLEMYFKDYDSLNLMKYTLSVSYKDYYLDFCNKLLINGDTKDKVMDKLKGITEYYIKDIVNFANNMVVITESLHKNNIPYIDIEDLTNYLLLNGYIMKGNYVFKSGISYGLICSLIVKKHFKNGIKIHDESHIEKLRKIIKSEFGGLNLPENNRALGTRLASFLVLCERGCYTVPSDINIPDWLISKIRDFIETSDDSTLFFSDLYVCFKDELLKSSNINNRYYLQGVLKYFYEDEFLFERDSITKLGKKKKSMREMISDFLKENKRPVHRKEIKGKFPGVTDVVITNAQLSNKDILQWEYNYYIHSANLDITKEDEEFILNCLNFLFDKYKGYLSEQLLYDFIVKTNKELLIKNYIKNASNLYYLTSYLYRDKFLFRRPHILRNMGPKKEISSKVIVEKFLFKDSRLKYTDYQKFVNEVKWSIGTTYAVFKDVEKHIVRISEDEYILKEKFDVDKSVVNRIFEIIDKELEKSEFISINKFKNFKKLPVIKYPWNEFLLSSMVQMYLPKELRLISPTVEDRRYVKEIIVRDDSRISSYEELIIDVIRNNDLNGSTLYHLESVLSSMGLIGRYLPKELYNSKNIYIENDRFYANV